MDRWERVQLDATGVVVDRNGPFIDADEAAAEAADLAADYRGIGWSVVPVDARTLHAFDSIFGDVRFIIVRPIA